MWRGREAEVKKLVGIVVFRLLLQLGLFFETRLLFLPGGDVKRLGRNIDGKNMWRHLSLNLASPRTEILYNIEPVQKIAALRYKSYKLVLGVHRGGVFDGRYQTTGGSRPRSDLDALMSKSKVAQVLRYVWKAMTTNDFVYKTFNILSIYSI
ncbi:hypothetical protein HPB48_001413 [Haemaphysalis longicornis]|uniref:Uncharacterized protein n=1 Tax=Haemaphysalis longicornis TaxID=44386 RepID=A0A9J6GZ68_HAELO|nr:hypothetical protein HPB48_001413 [Haemaphysalis longicornis]